LPCFLFIFLLAPYIELLANDQRLRAILIGVTAAVVGVVANLALYFARQVLFPQGISLGRLDIFALVVAVVSFVVLERYKVPIYLMVPVGAVLGMAWILL
jgi:chromate transporter